MNLSQQVVAKASQSFRHGNYQEALTLYQKAATLYGSQLFSANITLCQQRLDTQHDKQPVLPGSPAESRQLKETQGLLEHYYRRCQELEYQLLENATS